MSTVYVLYEVQDYGAKFDYEEGEVIITQIMGVFSNEEDVIEEQKKLKVKTEIEEFTLIE